MPIRFRCSSCNRLLGIARRKAGSETKCPHCGATIMVPASDEDDDERTRLDDIDELMNPLSAAPAPVIATRPATPSMPRAVARPVSEPLPLPEEEQPLFERDLDSVLQAHGATTAAEAAKPKPATTAGTDAMSLEPERNHLVISSQKATALVVIIVVLLALSFAAGFLIASR